MVGALFSGFAAPFPRGEGGLKGRKRNGETCRFGICLVERRIFSIFARIPLQSSASVPDADDSFSPGEALGASAPEIFDTLANAPTDGGGIHYFI